MFFLFFSLEKITRLVQNYIMKLVRKNTVFQILLFAVIMVGLGSLFYYNSVNLGYRWQWYRIPRYIITRDNGGALVPGALAKGLGVTLFISFISLIFANIIGLLTAILRLSSSFTGRLTAKAYLELVRNTPLLIQILFTYFVLAPLFGMSPFFSAVISLSLFEGAYTSEIIRGGILAVPQGQWESAYSLGLSTLDTYRYCIIPQTFRQILPPLASQSVSLIKDSALVSTIAIYDLTMAGQAIISKTFLTFEIWFVVALVYLAVTIPISVVIRSMEKRISYEN